MLTENIIPWLIMFQAKDSEYQMLEKTVATELNDYLHSLEELGEQVQETEQQNLVTCQGIFTRKAS